MPPIMASTAISAARTTPRPQRSPATARWRSCTSTWVDRVIVGASSLARGGGDTRYLTEASKLLTLSSTGLFDAGGLRSHDHARLAAGDTDRGGAPLQSLLHPADRGARRGTAREPAFAHRSARALRACARCARHTVQCQRTRGLSRH